MEQQHTTSPGNGQSRSQAQKYARPKRAVLLIDMDNFFLSRTDAVKETNRGGYFPKDLEEDLKVLKRWVGFTLGATQLTIARAYADFRKLAYGIPASLMTQGIEPVQVFTLSAQKNAADLRMAMEAAYAVLGPTPADCIILVAGDHDYVPVLLQLRGLGAEVWVVGGDHSNSGDDYKSTGTYVPPLANRFWYFDQVEKEYEDRRNSNARREHRDNTPPTVDQCKAYLAGIEPRFKLIPKQNWDYIVKKIYDEMTKLQPVTPYELVEKIQDDPEIGNKFARAVVGQLLYSICLKPEPALSGAEVSKQCDEWKWKVRLAQGTKGPEDMQVRTRVRILSELRSRLKKVANYSPEPPAEVIAELFFGSRSSSDLEAAKKLLNISRKPPQPSAKSAAAGAA